MSLLHQYLIGACLGQREFSNSELSSLYSEPSGMENGRFCAVKMNLLLFKVSKLFHLSVNFLQIGHQCMANQALCGKVTWLVALRLVQNEATFLSGVPVKVEVSTKNFHV